MTKSLTNAPPANIVGVKPNAMSDRTELTGQPSLRLPDPLSQPGQVVRTAAFTLSRRDAVTNRVTAAGLCLGLGPDLHNLR